MGDKIQFYYDFNNPQNTTYSLRMFAHLIEAEVSFQCHPLNKKSLEPIILTDPPTISGGRYRGSHLDLPEVLEDLKRNLLEIKASL